MSLSSNTARFRYSWVAALVLAGMVALSAPASAADSGWLPNTMCYAFNLGNAHIVTYNTSDKRYVSADEDPAVSGNIGMKIHYGNLLSPVLYGQTRVVWTSSTDISEFRVYH